jgi:hypothetical protein
LRARSGWGYEATQREKGENTTSNAHTCRRSSSTLASTPSSRVIHLLDLEPVVSPL